MESFLLLLLYSPSLCILFKIVLVVKRDPVKLESKDHIITIPHNNNQSVSDFIDLTDEPSITTLKDELNHIHIKKDHGNSIPNINNNNNQANNNDIINLNNSNNNNNNNIKNESRYLIKDDGNDIEDDEASLPELPSKLQLISPLRLSLSPIYLYLAHNIIQYHLLPI